MLGDSNSKDSKSIFQRLKKRPTDKAINGKLLIRDIGKLSCHNYFAKKLEFRWLLFIRYKVGDF
jgi:hypothetical protein